jgi:hypothetical protein
MPANFADNNTRRIIYPLRMGVPAAKQANIKISMLIRLDTEFFLLYLQNAVTFPSLIFKFRVYSLVRRN